MGSPDRRPETRDPLNPERLPGGNPRAIALHAISADSLLLQELASGTVRGRVHSVFERVINVEDATGALFTLASCDLDDAPGTVVVDAPGLGAFGIAAGDATVAAQGKLRIGDRLVVWLDTSRSWSAVLPGFPADDSRLRTNLRVLASHLERCGRGGGALPPPGASALADRVASTLSRRATLLLDALAGGAIESAREHGRAIVGLGPGLTPSGDDFLVGLFTVLNVPGSACHAWRGVCTEILSGAAAATHPISLAALVNAARGRVRASISALAQQLMYGSRDELLDAADRVLAIGSTSGTDLLAGIVSGFDLVVRVEDLRSGSPRSGA